MDEACPVWFNNRLKRTQKLRSWFSVFIARAIPKRETWCHCLHPTAARTPQLLVFVADSVTMVLTVAAALAGVVGVILLIGRVLKHTNLARPQSSARLLIVKDTISLDARRRLHLVQHGERSVLLLTGGETDVVVGWLDGSKAP
jgi:hypothetical protein